MNSQILQKCITELQKEIPDLSYLRGMLETLLEIQGVGMPTISGSGGLNIREGTLTSPNFPSVGRMVTTDTPEGMAVEAALAALEGMPKPAPGILEKNITLN